MELNLNKKEEKLVEKLRENIWKLNVSKDWTLTSINFQVNQIILRLTKEFYTKKIKWNIHTYRITEIKKIIEENNKLLNNEHEISLNWRKTTTENKLDNLFF